MNNSLPWNDNGPRPRFGRRARLWFFRSICYHLPAQCQKHRIGEQVFPEVDVEKFAAALLESAERYVEWVPEDGYRGSGYYTGEWRVLWWSVVANVYREGHRFAPEIALEEWLRRDLAGFAPTGAPEASVGDLLGDAASERAAVRRREWPRACSCGESFRPKRRNAKHCPACVAARKSANAQRS